MPTLYVLLVFMITYPPNTSRPTVGDVYTSEKACYDFLSRVDPMPGKELKCVTYIPGIGN